MLDLKAQPALSFPDDPKKWDGWGKYKASNPYERLCFEPQENPTAEEIQQHCAALLQWWHKKLPLKNQPSNPLAQLLGRGIDEAPTYLVQARMQLLDPERRRQVDEELNARAQEEALAEFSKYVAFSLARRLLTAEAEAHLAEFGQRSGLTEEQTRACIEQELLRNNAKRVAPEPEPAPEAAPPPMTNAEAEKEFVRILRLCNLDLGDATARVRRIFATLAENLGINLERAEHVLDDYLEQVEYGIDVNAPPTPPRRIQLPAKPAPVAARKAPAAPSQPPPATPPSPRRIHLPSQKGPGVRTPVAFAAPIGTPMIRIPAGDFLMGSVADDAAPNEQPITPVTLSEFYMARYPVTNAQYELFDPSHKTKRMPGAGDDHPVVYVSSLEAMKYCHWLSVKDGKSYRLPTEAEWEYAARGTDGRKYPWGNHERRGDFANFADASTSFAWRDLRVSDGYPETSPVGAFPRGASFFGLEDMAGNVWEWCLDFLQPLPGTPKRNPRGVPGTTRIYRGGSWKSRFSNLRATARSSNAPSFASNDVGFRLACDLDPVAKAADENGA